MPRYRNRSTSHGSFHDHHHGSKTYATEPEDTNTAKTLMNAAISLQDSSGRSFLHTRFNLTMAKAMLDRAKALDTWDGEEASILWQRRCLLQADKESRYTPLHSAVMDRNLAAILLFLRQAIDKHNTERLTQPPMAVLYTSSAESLGRSDHDLVQEMATAVDREGFTPLELLGRLQRKELAHCRKRLMTTLEVVSSLGTNRRRPRQSSFDDGQHQAHEELALLTDHMDLLETRQKEALSADDECSYACEVVTFGRPNHCALGVVSSSNNEGSKRSSAFRPQRVQEFAQESIGRDGSAVAVAAANHHTLIATKNGHLYAFGLGKGGRLGIGDDQVQQCLLPRRVRGPLGRHKVVGVAAAENHSLCVTSSGILFAWGSNRFGQLGSVETKSLDSSLSPSKGSSGSNNNFRCLPRRVEDLRSIPCIAVAAGEKHSVALSRRGEVYVWGDNTAGQLGIPRRSGIQKVQRVEALWNTDKTGIAISASEQSTLVLTSPIAGFAQVNSVYAWGHGNYVPSRVNFEENGASRNSAGQESLSSRTRRVINPVGIACAKYHNTAITSDGHVYTWGLHAESLGRTNKQQHSASTTARATSSPQLVTGMLPENGGGVAVALSASDQHTAIVTDCGALFTWGATYGSNVLGHEGVRYQPSPKRVAGVHRAVNVAVAKEHTVLLIGSTFPRIPIQSGLNTLELLAAQKVAEYVDLFNVIPILIMAERTECSSLIAYCSEFIHRNLDGVLNVGKKSVMNQYLNDMLADSLHRSGRRYRDDHHHPFVTDVITAGNTERPKFDRGWLSNKEEWIAGCNELSDKLLTQKFLASISSSRPEEDFHSVHGRRRQTSCGGTTDFQSTAGRGRSLSTVSDYESNEKTASSSRFTEGVLDNCIKKTANMDLSSSEVAKENSMWLAKEIRGVRKKLNQIKKLQDWESDSATVLSSEQRAKVDRRPTLEAELCIYESALEEAEGRIKDLALEDQNQRKAIHSANGMELGAALSRTQNEEMGLEKCIEKVNKQAPVEEKQNCKSFACAICSIKCPDQRSFELHKNGRKHRNRVSQAAEREKAKAATTIMERRHLDQVKSPGHVVYTPPVAMQPKAAWGVASAQPKFKLAPPPHATLPPVSALRLSWKTYDQSQHQAPLATSAKATASYGSTTTTKKGEKNVKLPAVIEPLNPLGSPVWHSDQESSRCVPLGIYSSKNLSLATATQASHSKSFSLADFLAPTQSPISQTPGKKSWSSPTPKAISVPKSLSQIQAEETNFRARQDKAYEKGGGTWFIERRERADSLLEIQNSTVKEREEREFIEEQKRIEEQIQKELELHQLRSPTGQGKKNKKRGAAKRNPRQSPKPKSVGKVDDADRGKAKSSDRTPNVAAQNSGSASQKATAKSRRRYGKTSNAKSLAKHSAV